jgi:hypothetical protein
MDCERHELLGVSSLVEKESETLIAFHDGRVGVLPTCYPKYAWAVQYLKRSRDSRGLVAIVFAAENRIVSVAVPDRNVVLGLHPNEYDPNVVDVWFEGESGPYSLHKEHALFPRFHESLCCAKQSRQWIWWVGAGGDILDVKMVSPEEDAALCQLEKTA